MVERGSCLRVEDSVEWVAGWEREARVERVSAEEAAGEAQEPAR